MKVCRALEHDLWLVGPHTFLHHWQMALSGALLLVYSLPFAESLLPQASYLQICQPCCSQSVHFARCLLATPLKDVTTGRHLSLP